MWTKGVNTPHSIAEIYIEIYIHDWGKWKY